MYLILLNYNILKRLLINILFVIGFIPIKFYQYIISPFLIPSCRFVPSCSEYGLEAIKEWGLLIGSWLTLKRIIRCTPFCNSGYDPVPKKTINK